MKHKLNISSHWVKCLQTDRFAAVLCKETATRAEEMNPTQLQRRKGLAQKSGL